MYIRIKKRRLSPRNGNAPEYALRFLVVESHRSDGQPRQRIIKYLGSVKQKSMRNPTERARILASMQRKLDHLELEIPYTKVMHLKLNLIRLMHRPSIEK